MSHTNDKEKSGSYSEEVHQELNALKKQHLILKELCEAARIQQQKDKQQIAELSQQLKDWQSRPIPPQNPLNDAHRQEENRLNQALLDSQQHGKQLERVIQFLRDRAEEAQLEAKQLKEEFQVQQESINHLSRQYQDYQEKFNETALLLTQKETEIIQLQEKLISIEKQAQNIKEEQEEKEGHLKQAQQHLAKKMKELAAITEKVEEQRGQIIDLERLLSDVENQATMQLKAHEQQLLHEKRFQEQLQESLKQAELQSKKWESKYCQLYDKWTANETHHRSAKALEERYRQIQLLVTHLVGLVDLGNEKPTPISFSAMNDNLILLKKTQD